MTTFQERRPLRRPRRAILRQLAQLGRKMTLGEDDTRWIPPSLADRGTGAECGDRDREKPGA